MLSHRVANVTALLSIGAALAATNVWISASRSTIPTQLDALVVEREIRKEKHPGQDDVYLLQLEPNGLTQVDRRVYDSVRDGDLLRKDKWSRTLNANGNQIGLEWSIDFRGMLLAMPLTLAILLLTAIGICIWPTNHAR